MISFLWGLGAFALFIVAVLVCAVVMIQNSGEGGVGGAFGGGGGESILGARAQKGINRFTAYLGLILGALLLILGKSQPDPSTYEGDETTKDSISASTTPELGSAGGAGDAAGATGAGAPAAAGVDAALSDILSGAEGESKDGEAPTTGTSPPPATGDGTTPANEGGAPDTPTGDAAAPVGETSTPSGGTPAPSGDTGTPAPDGEQ